MGNGKTIKNKYAEVNRGNNPPPINEYVEKITEWRLWPGRYVEGVYYVRFHGHYITHDEFVKLSPRPHVVKFDADMNNVDNTRKWMHQ